MIRKCGECSLCCRLLPVRELGKRPNTRCVHQRLTGCNIYERRPLSCQLWSCLWLKGKGVDNLPRPDRAGYVIDETPDFVVITNEDLSETRVQVTQVWCDPKRPDAWRTPELKAHMERWANEGKATLIRYALESAITVFPPPLGDVWIEKESRVNFDLKPGEEWQR